MKTNTKIQKITLSALLTAVLCICSILSINLGGISYSLALLGVFIIGMTLSPIYSLISVIIYIIIGVFGVPVFANFNSGLGALFGPSGGFILSYPATALIVSLLTKKPSFNHIKVTVVCIFALTINYICGCLWYSYICETGFLNSIYVCVLPFIIFDLVKIQLAYLTSKIIRTKL